MDDVKAKQQIVDKIKEATNILITVSNDPSVDALSAAIGLSLLIDKLDKHATAVFSGKIPPAITFLEPEKTLEDTTDGLRDFIIALDKEKADHLRVKPEGDVVKIYVTPYRTTISPDDLTFSQGDYNVELVIALGVDVQEHLDEALDSHGKILHDATVATITAGEQVSNLGGIDWHEDKSSSLSEMVASLADGLKQKDKSLLDKQIATAFLTGIVAATDRFSNPRTTSKAMTVAASLMTAGADQQLIASKLDEGGEDLTDAPKPDEPDEPKPTDDGDVLNIAHNDDEPHSQPGETLEQMDKRVKAEEQKEAAQEAEKELEEEKKSEDAPKPDNSPIGDVHSGGASSALEDREPSFGGTLNATTDEAADDKRQALEDDQNKTILSHAYVGGGSSATMSGATADTADAGFVDPLSQPSTGQEVHSAYAFEPEEHKEVEPLPTLQPTTIGVPVTPTPAPLAPPAPADLGLPMPPASIPDFSQPNPAYGLPVAEPSLPPERLGDILAPEAPAAAPQVPTDPGQFKIPGQQ
jgi:hypothetical protein